MTTLKEYELTLGLYKKKGAGAQLVESRYSRFTNNRIQRGLVYAAIYKRGGLVTEAINNYASFILSKGIKLEGVPEHVNRITQLFDEVNIEENIYQSVIDALVFGEAFIEIAPSLDESTVGLFPLPALSVEPLFDEHGTLFGFVQRKSLASIAENVYDIDLTNLDSMSYDAMQLFNYNKDDDVIFFPKERMIYLVLDRFGGSPRGFPLIERAYMEITRDLRLASATTAAVERSGFPRYHIKVGAEGEDIPEEDLRSIASQFERLSTRNDFVTVRDVEISQIGQGNLAVRGYGEWTTQRLCAALGVPEEVLGLGRGSTEATARVRMSAFLDKIGAYQQRVARAFNKQLIDRFLKRSGLVRMSFNDIQPRDEESKAKWMSQIMMASGSPFAVLPREWIMQQFGIEPNKYANEMMIDKKTSPPNESKEGDSHPIL